MNPDKVILENMRDTACEARKHTNDERMQAFISSVEAFASRCLETYYDESTRPDVQSPTNDNAQ